MRNKPQARDTVMFCALCTTTQGQLYRCEGGYVCEGCAARGREGRDTTTQAVRNLQASMRGQADMERALVRDEAVSEVQAFKAASAEAYALDAMAVLAPPQRGPGGEVVPSQPGELRDTLTAPNAVALDASAHRLDLLTLLGNDMAALALDTASSIGASNSLEQMGAHQLALLHHSGMEMAAKAALQSDPAIAARSLSIAIRAVDTYFKGCIALQQLRGAITQPVHVGQVNVAAGGQAIVGNATTRRKRK